MIFHFDSGVFLRIAVTNGAFLKSIFCSGETALITVVIVFEYKYDYPRFLENMSHVIREAKKRRAEKPQDVYQNQHKLIIQ